MPYNCIPLYSKPGIQRDLTPYFSQCYIDGQWVRFYQELPRKIGGVQAATLGTGELIRSLFTLPLSDAVAVYMGRQDQLTYLFMPFTGAQIDTSFIEIDRTPAIVPNGPFDPNPLNQWYFDLYTALGSLYQNPQIIAHVVPDLENVNYSVGTSTNAGHIFYGDITQNTPLTAIVDKNNSNAPVQASGGITFIAPLLVIYGDNGMIQWNNPAVSGTEEELADPLNTWSITLNDVVFPFNATIANTKIIYGCPIVGAQQPTALFWSLNSLSQVSFATETVNTGTEEELIYTATSTVRETQVSILSSKCVVRWGQTFFWIGVDQFYMFDGVVRPLSNSMNLRWFFDNINLNYRNKVFGVAIPAYNEIWWCFPHGESEENNWAIIYNTQDTIWYDTPLTRSCGSNLGFLPYPLMADSQQQTVLGHKYFPLWQHETGTDQVFKDNVRNPIISSYTHNFQEIATSQGSNNRMMRSRRIEPDFDISGQMTMTVNNMNFPSQYGTTNMLTDGPYTFDENTPYIDLESQGRFVSVTFVSNYIGGNYQAGKTLYDWEVGDASTAAFVPKE